MASSNVPSTLGAGLVVGSVFSIAVLATATTATATGTGQVYEDTSVIEQSSGLYSVTKTVKVCADTKCESTAAVSGHPMVKIRYTAMDEADSMNDQVPGTWYVDDFMDGPLPGTVFVMATRTTNGQDQILFSDTVEAGAAFMIDAEGAASNPSPLGNSNLPTPNRRKPKQLRGQIQVAQPNVAAMLGDSVTIKVYDHQFGTMLQEIMFDTSGQQPLNLGDRFGSAMVVGLSDENLFANATAGGCDVDSDDGLFTYRYQICNDTDSALDLIRFELLIPANAIVGVGAVCGAGEIPFSSYHIEMDRIQFDYFSNYPTIGPGECSCEIIILSPLGPDVIGASISGQAGLDTPTTCVGPAVMCDLCPGGDTCYSCPSGILEGPPCYTPPFECDGKITSLTMRWDGTQAIDIIAYDGDTSDPVLTTINGIQIGDTVTVSGLTGQNDVFWEIFAAGTTTKLGESKFHRSCSDSDMNGVEDCGLNQGDGKNDDAGFINDWILEGLVDEAGGVLTCP